ncbi:hypothetical protein EG329_006757 [Mollisiaceae sp. DMI_Dod_QoI]|nr:hypothetical protein EG329_006757 [Helotiales sp. DMI_Dod_QoI]
MNRTALLNAMPLVENLIQPAQAHYIDQKKLERLLEKLFRRKIVVLEKNEVFIFRAPRLLREDEIE